MPSTNQYGSRKAVYVTPFNGSGFKYGFRTNVKAATGTSCGHADVNFASLPADLVFGCNTPKPGRASRLNGDEYEGSFFDYTKYAALKAEGWRTSKPFTRIPKITTRSVTVFVSTNSTASATGTIKYGWAMQISLYTKIEAELDALGIELATAGAQNIIFGAQEPKPPRVSKVVVGDGGVDNLSTFCAPAKLDSLPAGWATAGSSRQYVSIG